MSHLGSKVPKLPTGKTIPTCTIPTAYRATSSLSPVWDPFPPRVMSQLPHRGDDKFYPPDFTRPSAIYKEILLWVMEDGTRCLSLCGRVSRREKESQSHTSTPSPLHRPIPAWCAVTDSAVTSSTSKQIALKKHTSSLYMTLQDAKQRTLGLVEMHCISFPRSYMLLWFLLTQGYEGSTCCICHCRTIFWELSGCKFIWLV